MTQECLVNGSKITCNMAQKMKLEDDLKHGSNDVTRMTCIWLEKSAWKVTWNMAMELI